MQFIFDSLWFTISYPFILIVSVAGGYAIARGRYLKKQRSWKPSGIENSIIGFYGLLLSFALLSAGNANRERANLVHLHADALGAINREAILSNDSVGKVITDHVRDILSARLQSRNIKTSADVNSSYQVLIEDLKAMRKSKSISPDGLRFYMDKIHIATSLDYGIYYSQQERTPITIMTLLIVGSLLIGILVGFTNGFNEEHHFLVPVIFIVLTSLTIVTILDMDNPGVGFIQPSYKNYEDMLKGM